MDFKKITDTIYEMTVSDGTEHAEIYLLQLFPGIFLGINYVNIRRITGSSEEANSVRDSLRINYCFDGRCEVKLVDGRYVYVTNNALCIEDHEPQYNFYYPLGFYKGIQIFIDKDTVKKQPCEVFDLFGIQPHIIVNKYSNTRQTFIQNASAPFARKAAKILSVWENKAFTPEHKVQQIRFILCQLFYYLIHDEAITKEQAYDACTLSHSQYRIAIDCEQKITKNLAQKHTVEALAAHYKISPSSLKNFFSGVYGCSISQYTQTMRMRQAQTLLETTDWSILQIASAVGYENQSKFSAVFKKHTGYAPLEYKRIHNLKRNEETT